jgi:hypothetical protein
MLNKFSFGPSREDEDQNKTVYSMEGSPGRITSLPVILYQRGNASRKPTYTLSARAKNASSTRS